MAIRIEVDQKKLENLQLFFGQVVATVYEAAQKAALKEAKDIREEWRRRSTKNQVPGTFSDKWKKYKSSLGLRTEDLQRFGRGDSRSYYENIRIAELKPRGGALVGVFQGTPAYDIRGRRTSGSLEEIAKTLESDHPLWRDIWISRPPKLLKTFKKVLKDGLIKLGATDAQ